MKQTGRISSTRGTEHIEALIAPALEALGYAIVRIHLSGQRQKRLQVMIERLDGGTILVDHCAEASREISPILDVADPIAEAYTLEVSSPGIDRPLVRLSDFERFAGFEARVEMDRIIDGRRRIKGRIVGVDGGRIRMTLEDGEIELPYEDIQRAKLILTDDLIAAHQAQSGEQETEENTRGTYEQ